jgi:hypothetical protein
MTDYNALPVHIAWESEQDHELAIRENANTYRALHKVCSIGYEPISDRAVLMDLGASRWGVRRYKVLSNPIGLDSAHLALFADQGDLCFGYGAGDGIIDIYKD